MTHRTAPLCAAALAAACAHAPSSPHGAPHAHDHGHGHGHGPGPGAPGHHHAFTDASEWARTFDDPARDAWQQPDQVVRALGLAPDARVADVGAGTGYFSVRLARAVPQGRVWGVDIEPTMVRYLRERAQRESIPNLYAVLGAPSDPLLPEPVDLVLVVDTNHHIDDRPSYYRALRSSLRPGGRVVIVDYDTRSPHGPPPAMRLSPDTVRAEFDAAGYVPDGEPATLPYQYVLSFRPRP